ncbi:hypothetical protein [Eupransor demetentiae]|uniref:Glycine zipper 2TM domain-containing protein n=1 Tax=Eupransor demetentiae TaxID=3109584 RepID=A0ABM9N5M0_9LACO|nr:hypothetical protein R54876_GBNLAHCA_01067 [Lactobacillaceae bacterium LMG 33000]
MKNSLVPKLIITTSMALGALAFGGHQAASADNVTPQTQVTTIDVTSAQPQGYKNGVTKIRSDWGKYRIFISRSDANGAISTGVVAASTAGASALGGGPWGAAGGVVAGALINRVIGHPVNRGIWIDVTPGGSYLNWGYQ